MEYYLAMRKKKKKILPFAKMRMGPESIMLSEVGQAEENKHGLISLTY